MRKIIASLIIVGLITGCAGGQLKVEEAKKIKKVAIVGFTMDHAMSFKQNFKSVLKGEQNNNGREGGPVMVDGAFGKKEPLASYTYNEASKALKKSGWRVLSYGETLKSPSLKKYYNKRVKKGFFPLVRGRKRLEVPGIPQHYYIQGLRKSPVLDAITKELKVDALLFVYTNTTKKCIGVAGNCVNTPKYKSEILFSAYDALRDQRVINMTHRGPSIKKQTKPLKKLNKIEAAMLIANAKAFEELAEKLNTKLK